MRLRFLFVVVLIDWRCFRVTDLFDLGMSSWTDIMPPVGKKRTGFGPHPESEHPGQMRLECRSRTAISCDSHERREQHFRRPAEKRGRFLARTKKPKTPARGGWKADGARPLLRQAEREGGSIPAARQKKRTV